MLKCKLGCKSPVKEAASPDMRYFLCLSVSEVLQGHPEVFGVFCFLTTNKKKGQHVGQTMHREIVSTGTRESRYLRSGGLVWEHFC